jgi:hypothetical protein
MQDSLGKIAESIKDLQFKNLNNEQKKVIDAFAVIIDYMVKDSSITWRT